MPQKIKDFWNKYKKSKIAWTGIVVIIAILVFVLHKGGSHAQSDTFTVASTNVVDSVMLSGRTQSASAVSLGFADQGRVSEVDVAEGDKVHAGEVLARLDTADLQASLLNAQAALQIAQAGATSNTTNLQTVTDQQNTLVDSAYRTMLSQGLQAIPNDVDSRATPPIITGNYTGDEGQYDIHFYSSGADSGLSFTLSGLESGPSEQVTASTPVPLGTKGLYIQFAPGQAYTGDWVVEIPNTTAAAYTANYNAYQSALTARSVAINTAESSVGTSSADQSVGQAKIEEAQASVDSILAQIADRTIVAPFDGVVANDDLKPGQTTSSVASDSTDATGTSDDQITLISENDYQVVLDAPEISVAKLAVGQAVAITLDAYGTGVVFPGKIISIDPAETILDGVPVYETKVAFTTADSRIRSGMTATATIDANESDNVLAVPASFIHTDSTGTYVYVIGTDGKTSKQMIVTGLRGSDSMVEVTSGLTAGQKIQTDPSN